MILRCTKKVLDLLGSRPGGLSEPPPSDDDWYANLIWLNGRKCLLLTHAGTLFPVFVADVRKADLRDTGRYVVDLIAAELRDEDVPEDGLGRLDPSAVELAPTVSRGVLGFMNDMAFHCQHHVARGGDLDDGGVRDLSRRLRRVLHNIGGVYVTPIEAVGRRSGRAPQASPP